MTRKHYIALASALRNARPWNYEANDKAPACVAWLASVAAVSETCGRDNARFNSDRFLTACGVS
jgi:hypothetical protein